MSSSAAGTWTTIRLTQGTLAHIASPGQDDAGPLRTACGMTIPQDDTATDPHPDLYALCHGCRDHAIDANQNRTASR